MSDAPATRTTVLDAARQAVTVDRAATHGAAEDSFGRLAAVWSARLGVTLTPVQAALMLADLKICRAWGNPDHGDNFVDLAGYAACAGELAGAAPVTAPPFRSVRPVDLPAAMTLGQAVMIATALRDGLGVDDIEAAGYGTSTQARDMLRIFRAQGYGVAS